MRIIKNSFFAMILMYLSLFFLIISLHDFYISCIFIHTNFAKFYDQEWPLLSVYGVPTCDKIKKTKSFLEQNNIEYIFFNVRKEPLDKVKLAEAVNQLGLNIVLNRKGLLYKKLGLKDKNLTDKQLFNELLNEQGMIKRPLIEKNGNYLCGYDEQAILAFAK